MKHTLLGASHIRTVSSSEPDTMSWPSSENAMALTEFEWPRSNTVIGFQTTEKGRMEYVLPYRHKWGFSASAWVPWVKTPTTKSSKVNFQSRKRSLS